MRKQREFNLRNGQYGAAITVQVAGRSKASKVSGILEDGTIQIELNADRKDTDRELLNFLAEILAVPLDKLKILAEDSRAKKLISILDMDAEKVQQKFLNQIG